MFARVSESNYITMAGTRKQATKGQKRPKADTGEKKDNAKPNLMLGLDTAELSVARAMEANVRLNSWWRMQMFGVAVIVLMVVLYQLQQVAQTCMENVSVSRFMDSDGKAPNTGSVSDVLLSTLILSPVLLLWKDTWLISFVRSLSLILSHVFRFFFFLWLLLLLL